MRWLVLCLTAGAVAAAVAGAVAEPRSPGSERGKSARGRPQLSRPGRIALPDGDDDSTTDGTKIFTADTETLDPGSWSLSAAYFFSQARRMFDDGGAQSDLGGTRDSSLIVLSVSGGIADNFDLTVAATGNRVDDFFRVAGAAADGSLGPVQGAGLTNLALQGRWRFLPDSGDGFSLALVGGPALQELLLADDEDTAYQIRGAFTSWQQSLVVRQDVGRASFNLELYYAFPLSSGVSTYQQLGANLGCGYNLDDWLVPVVELNYARLIPSSDPISESWTATLGVVLKPNDTSAISLAVQKTLAGRNIENFTTYALSGSIGF